MPTIMPCNVIRIVWPLSQVKKKHPAAITNDSTATVFLDGPVTIFLNNPIFFTSYDTCAAFLAASPFVTILSVVKCGSLPSIPEIPSCTILRRVAIGGAWENQFTNVSIEGSAGYGSFVLSTPAINVRGLPVTKAYAQFLEDIGEIPKGTVRNAPRIPE